MFFNKKDNDSKQRFGIRKLTVGACSVLLSTLILGTEIQEQTSKVQAATTDASQNVNTTDPADNSKNKNTYVTASEVKETNNQTTVVSNEKEKADENTQNSASVTENSKLNPANGENEADSKKDNSAQVVDLKTNDENKNPVNTKKENTAEKTENPQAIEKTQRPETEDGTTNVEKANKTIATTNIKNISDSSNTHSDTNNLDVNKGISNSSINKLEETVNSSKSRTANVSRISALAASTENMAEADQIKADAAITIPSSDGRYTLYISRNNWGNTTDGTQPVKVLLSGNVLTGDVVSISIPSYGIVPATPPTLDPNYGTALIKDIGPNKVVTYNFTTSGVINPIIRINPDNGYGAKSTPMQITQLTVKDIIWTINGVEQKSAEFHIDVNPIWNPKFSLSKPNPNSTDENALKKMIPNYESIYQLAISETNGVAPGQDYKVMLIFRILLEKLIVLLIMER